MKGFLYIASAFKSLRSTGCKEENQVDNDPNIWSKPYTWGICRPDLRERIQAGDYVFFVLGANAQLPQMIFAYLKIDEIISHSEAFFRKELKNKRMSNKLVNGNIIVDYFGDYNQHDMGIHEDNFDKIKKRYAIADMSNSRVLTKKEIVSKAPYFMTMLNDVFSISGTRPIDVISRAGIQKFSKQQVLKIIDWLNTN